LTVSGKFCPICKHKNPRTATVCGYCGALLEENTTSGGATTKNTDEQSNIPVKNTGPFIDIALIPEGGLAIYINEAITPLYLQLDRELIIGRNTEKTSETFLDLFGVDAFNLGLSRRHAIIRRAESGFEVIDLASTNGSWLNGERLIPNKPYPLASGSQLRFARMQLHVIYNPKLKGTKKI
jgi:pSer/pThr/pTyr-binding forkhead associated (FHA) protein